MRETPLDDNQIAAANEILGNVFAALLKDKSPEAYTLAITALSDLRRASTLAEGNGDTLPMDLMKGDRFLFDNNQFQVIGTPWRTDIGNSLLDEFIAVPVDGDHTPLMLNRDTFLVTDVQGVEIS